MPSARAAGHDRDPGATVLDLSALPSPVLPPWLAGNGPIALPFDEGTLDRVIVGDDVLARATAPGLLAEAQRVLRKGGELHITLGHGARGRDDSRLLIEAVAAVLDLGLRLDAAEVGQETTTIVATRVTPDDAVVRPSVIAGLVMQAVRGEWDRADAVSELERLTQTELAAASDRIRHMEGQLHEQRLLIGGDRRRIEELSALVKGLTSAQHDIKVVSDQRLKDLQSARDRLAKLEQEYDQLRYRERYERWRADVAADRKALRIAEAAKRARRPWLAPAALYQIARIAISRSRYPAPPAGPPQVQKGQKSGGGSRGSNRGGRPDTTDFPRFQVPTVAPRRQDVRVATVLDEFSELFFRYEFPVVPVPRQGWREVLAAEAPDLLLVESAWNGNGGQWKFAFTGDEVPKTDFLELLEYCRENDIPTVFWNKEDPLEYELFVRTAKHFDWVFTVDENCVERYRKELGHDRVRVLPFGVQPRIHSPVDSFGPRPYEVAFAGTFYSGKYPERQEQIEYLLTPCRDLGLHIYSRWESNPRYAFPADLRDAVIGSLDYLQVLNAYRRYKVFLNVNSVVDSRTMFSRRVLELLACGTPVVSGPSPGMAAMLGPEVVRESRDRESSRRAVRTLLQSPELRDRQAVRGIRAVMSSHTSAHRADELLTALGHPARQGKDFVSVVTATNRADNLDRVIENVSRQRHRNLELIIGLHGLDDETDVRTRARAAGIDEVKTLHAPTDWTLGQVLNEACQLASGDYLAKMDDDDIYGANYLGDQLLAFEYTDADIVGKWSRFIYLESVPCVGVIFPGHEHRYTELVGGGTLLFRREVFDRVRFPDRRVGEDTGFLREAATLGFRTYSTDRFNHIYVRHADVSRHTYQLDDAGYLANTRVLSYGRAFDHAFV